MPSTPTRWIRSLFLSLLLCFIWSGGTTANLDSLIREVKNYDNDTHKINLLNSISSQLGYYEINDAIKYSYQCKKLIDSIETELLTIKTSETNQKFKENLFSFIQKAKGKNRYNLSWANYQKELPDSALDYAFEALRDFSALRDEDGIYRTCNLVSYIYISKREYDKSKAFLKRSLAIAEDLNDTLKQVRVIDELASVYRYEKKRDSVLITVERAISMLKSKPDTSILIELLNMRSIAHYELGNYDESFEIKWYLIKILKSIGDSSTLSLIYYNAAIGYSELGDYSKALDYAYRGLQISLEIKSNSRAIATYQYIGFMFKDLGDYAMSLKYQMMAFEILKDLGNDAELANFYSDVAGIYEDQNNYKEALKYYTKYLVASKKIQNNSNIADAYYHVGKVYLSMKQYDKAKDYLNHSAEKIQSS